MGVGDLVPPGATVLIGYARTSTDDQKAGLDAQLRDLKTAGCKKIFSEQVSSVAARAKLEEALDYLRDGDMLVVTKLDRLARSMRHLLEIVERIEKKEAGLIILAMNLDTTTPTGKLILHVFGAIAEWERAMMLERQREGIAKAKSDGKYRGRPARRFERLPELKALLKGGMPIAKAAREMKIGRATIYRMLDNDKTTKTPAS